MVLVETFSGPEPRVAGFWRAHAAGILAALAALALTAEHAAQPAVPATPSHVGALLAARLPDAEAALARQLAAALARRPPHGQTSALFDAAMLSPFGFPAPLAAMAARIAPLATAPSARPLQGLLRQWRAQFGTPDTCASPALPPPADLDQAIAQVRALAAATVAAQRGAISARVRRKLAGQHAALARLLRTKHTGAMRRGERRPLRRFVRALSTADLAPALCAATTWAALADPAWLRALRRVLTAHPKAGAAQIHAEESPWGAIVFGGSADGQVHSRTLLFLADLGGDDLHAIDGAVDFSGHPQFIVDFAGDDRYESTAAGGYGAGVGRTAIVVDFAGDDRYRSGAQGQGYALFGVGALLDWAGNDHYTARHSAQGAAWFGAGLLLDGGGDDRYAVDALGQGVGLPNGLGWLLDRGGKDTYVALGGPPTNYGTPGLADAWAQGVARGLRGIAPGGVGVLADFGGDDAYDAGTFAQGGGYYRGVGQLLDYGAGRDTLFGSRYNAGWGAHGGVGRFFNEAGDDHYATRHIVGAGLAWDYSLAVFHDGAGNDVYRLPGFSFGSAAHGSAGLFVDTAGQDAYHGAKPVHAQTGPPNLAVLVDGDSADDAPSAVPGAPTAPSCVHTGQHAVVLLGSGGTVPRCAEETLPRRGP